MFHVQRWVVFHARGLMIGKWQGKEERRGKA